MNPPRDKTLRRRFYFVRTQNEDFRNERRCLMKKFSLFLCAVGLVLCTTSHVQATLVRQDFWGEADYSFTGNPFGVEVGDVVSGYAIYDDDAVDDSSIDFRNYNPEKGCKLS
jgi:hypothetical protein